MNALSIAHSASYQNPTTTFSAPNAEGSQFSFKPTNLCTRSARFVLLALEKMQEPPETADWQTHQQPLQAEEPRLRDFATRINGSLIEYLS